MKYVCLLFVIALRNELRHDKPAKLHVHYAKTQNSPRTAWASIQSDQSGQYALKVYIKVPATSRLTAKTLIRQG